MADQKEDTRPLGPDPMNLRDPPRTLSMEELEDAGVPVARWNECAHTLAPLMKCRQFYFHSPFECHHEKHEYEACMYKRFLREQAVALRDERRRREQETASAASKSKGGK